MSSIKTAKLASRRFMDQTKFILSACRKVDPLGAQNPCREQCWRQPHVVRRGECLCVCVMERESQPVDQTVLKPCQGVSSR